MPFIFLLHCYFLVCLIMNANLYLSHFLLFFYGYIFSPPLILDKDDVTDEAVDGDLSVSVQTI